MPIIAVFGPMRDCSSRASSSQIFSASGSFGKVLLQDKLRRDRVDLAFPGAGAAQPGLGLDRGKALVYPRHRQLEAPLQTPREVLGLARHRVRVALRRGRPTDDQRGRPPLFHQLFYLRELPYGGKRMRGAQLQLADRYSDALKTKFEGENGARGPLRHVPLRPAAWRSPRRATPWRPAAALRPACRR